MVLDQNGNQPVGATCANCYFNGEGHACSLQTAPVVVSDGGVGASKFSEGSAGDSSSPVEQRFTDR